MLKTSIDETIKLIIIIIIIIISDSFSYLHYGNFTYNVDERAEVAILSRNVLIEGVMEDECYFNTKEEQKLCKKFQMDTFGGHILVSCLFAVVLCFSFLLSFFLSLIFASCSSFFFSPPLLSCFFFWGGERGIGMGGGR